MLFTQQHDLKVKFNNQPLSRNNKAKYLTLVLDNKLTLNKYGEYAFLELQWLLDK